MVNPFSGIIDSSFKSVFNNAISALLEDDSLTIACTLEYGITKYEDCVNCLYDPIGQKSSNRSQHGAPVPFPFGTICPLCKGNKIESISISGSKLYINYNHGICKWLINIPFNYTS